jgi:hypothetical protein
LHKIIFWGIIDGWVVGGGANWFHHVHLVPTLFIEIFKQSITTFNNLWNHLPQCC